MLPAVLRPFAISVGGSFLMGLGPAFLVATRSTELTVAIIVAIAATVYVLTMRDAVRSERLVALAGAAAFGIYGFVSAPTTLDLRVTNFLVFVPILYVWLFTLGVAIHALAGVVASLRRPAAP